MMDICVLIPCYNNIKGLIRSIKSIKYPVDKMIVLVVDDGSTIAITRSDLYKTVDFIVNIHIIRLPVNQGITKALNEGLEFIEANYPVTYIARLDCGDVCYPGRFTKQVEFLNAHPDIALLGSWCYFKEKNADAYAYTTPGHHEMIVRSMYFRNVFVHPTIMWRTSLLKQIRYPENYPHAEDYGLFYDIVSLGKTAILNEFLVICEINKNGISFLNRSVQLQSRLKVIWHYGNNIIWQTAGALKLILLMAIPQQLIHRVKKKMFRQHLAETIEN